MTSSLKSIQVNTFGTWQLVMVVAHLTGPWGYVRQKKKRLGTAARKHACSVKLSQSNKCENHTTASYLAPKVGKLRRCGTAGVSGRWMDVVREELWRLPKCLLTRSGSWRGFVCVCADGWAPNPRCHILFPAKHLAQHNWLVSAEVIMV